MGAEFSTLQEKIDPNHTAVVVIDMQNDFCARGGHLDRLDGQIETLQAIVPSLRALVKGSKSIGAKVIFVVSDFNDYYLHNPIREIFGRERFSLAGTWGAEPFEIKPNEEDQIITKRTYDAFVGTKLDEILKKSNIKTLVLSGVITNVCVESAARTGFSLGYHIVLPSDCVGYRRKNLHEASLENIERYYGTVTNSENLLALWQGQK